MRRDEERIIGKKINEKRVMELEIDKTMLRVIEDRPAMQRSFGDCFSRFKEKGKQQGRRYEGLGARASHSR